MKGITLECKLLFGPMIMVCLVMVASLIVVVTVLRTQNKNASYDQVRKAAAIVEWARKGQWVIEKWPILLR